MLRILRGGNMSCNGTPKIFQMGARSLENGKNGVNQSDGWGADNSVRALSTNDGLPWLSLEIDEDYGFKEDDSVTSRAFKSSPRLMSIKLGKPISFLDRYYGQDDLNYWMFGFENAVKPVIIFKAGVDPFSDTPAVGDVYTQGGNNFTYLRTIKNRGVNNTDFYMYIFTTDGTNLPTASGQLTEGANTFDYTEHSGQMYEHLFELDKSNRNFREYSTAEQSALTEDGWESGDKRNLMMTVGKRYNEYDACVRNLTCKKASWALTAGDDGEAVWSCDYVGYKKEEGDYDSDDWTLQDGGETQDNSPAHYETTFSIGTTFHDENLSGGDMIEINAKSANVNIEIPVDESQSFVSGLYNQCPLLNGAYNLSWDCLIGRHDTLTYQQRLRNLTKAIVHIQSLQGYYLKEFLIKKATLKKAGADNSEIADEMLEGSMDDIKPTDNPFTDWLHSHSELQDSPIVMRVVNYNPNNSMFLH